MRRQKNGEGELLRFLNEHRIRRSLKPLASRKAEDFSEDIETAIRLCQAHALALTKLEKKVPLVSYTTAFSMDEQRGPEFVGPEVVDYGNATAADVCESWMSNDEISELVLNPSITAAYIFSSRRSTSLVVWLMITFHPNDGRYSSR